MISVLIPTYNYKCYTLAHDLQQQLEKSGEDYEVIVADDGGKDQVVAISNHRINDLPGCRFIRRQENVGRAAIRNYLASEAKGEWLLFMDSDGEVVAEDFVKKYIDAAKEGHDVICGGIKHPDKCPSKEQSLRWKYEKEHEVRIGYISKCFRSFCFMIRKEVFEKVQFNESYRKYGLEDVQFGKDLQEKGYSIHAINNPLQNRDIETNEVFLRKTEEWVSNLHLFAGKLTDEVRLMKMVKRLKKAHVAWITAGVFCITKSMLKKNLCGSAPNLNVFAFYKLGYYLNLK